MNMNNGLLVCIKRNLSISYHKKKPQKTTNQKTSAFAGSKSIYMSSNIFHFQPQTCVSLNHSDLLPLLNLVKWDTDEGINSHVIYGEASTKLQYSLIILRTEEVPKKLCYHSLATQPNVISMPCDFSPKVWLQWRDSFGLESTTRNIQIYQQGASFAACFPQWHYSTENIARQYC